MAVKPVYRGHFEAAAGIAGKTSQRPPQPRRNWRLSGERSRARGFPAKHKDMLCARLTGPGKVTGGIMCPHEVRRDFDLDDDLGQASCAFTNAAHRLSAVV